MYSDHTILSFNLHCTRLGSEVAKANMPGKLFAKWDENKKGDFISRVESRDVERKANDLIEMLSTNDSVEILEEGILKVTDILVEAGDVHIKVYQSGREENRSHSKRGNEWYNEDCVNQRGLFLEGLRRYQETGDAADRLFMVRNRNRYRDICRRSKREFDRIEAQRLVQLSEKKKKEKLSYENFENLSRRNST